MMLNQSPKKSLEAIHRLLHKKWFLFTFFFLVVGMPRFLMFSAHWGSDEARWLHRSKQFMSAIEQGKFSETLIAHHPGVMTMWISGLRTFFIQPSVNVLNLEYARFFIGVFIWAGMGLACLLLYKLFGKWITLASFACLAYSPLFLAQTRRVHTDALAATFILLTVLLFLCYCQNRQHLRYLIFSGIAFGLALLSKSYALILLPWIPLCLFLFREKQKTDFSIHIAGVVIFLNGAALTVFLLWPVFWTPLWGIMSLCVFGLTCLLFREMKEERCPVWLVAVAFAWLCFVGVCAIQTTWIVFEKVNWAVTTPHEVEHFFLGKVVNDPGWLFYPFVLTVKSTPLMLPLALIGCILLWKHQKDSVETSRHFKTGIALVVGILLFTLCLSGTSKKFPRYLLPAFPMLEILAAVGFVDGLKSCYALLVSLFGTQAPAKYKAALAILACVGFFFIQVFPVMALHPYYGTYYNLCWKATDITKVITVGDASGLDIAANYLNEKPNAYQMYVQVSPIGTQIVKHYFDGHAYSADLHIRHIAQYEVVYIRDSQIGRVPQAGTLNGELEAAITLNDIDHVWIYRILPPEE